MHRRTRVLMSTITIVGRSRQGQHASNCSVNNTILNIQRASQPHNAAANLSHFLWMITGNYERHVQLNSNIERLSRGVAPQSAHEERCTTGNKQLRLSHPGRMPHNSPYNTAPCCVLPYQHDNYHQLPAAHLASPTATVSLAPATSLSSVRRLP